MKELKFEGVVMPMAGIGIRNVLNVAKKEFADLAGSWLVLVILAVFIVLTVFTDYGFYDIIARHNYFEGQIFNNFLFGAKIVLTDYGCLMAVAIGFASIASERQGNALNTLLVKPLYRDTIVNGKLLGALAFLLCVFGLVILLYTAGLFVVAGSMFATVFSIYLKGLPFVIGISLVFVMIFFSVSMLFSILFRSQDFALALSVLSVFISQTVASTAMNSGLSQLLGPGASAIAGWSPTNMLNEATIMLYMLPPGVIADHSLVSDNTVRLLIIMGVAVVVNYIVFLRKDVV